MSLLLLINKHFKLSIIISKRVNSHICISKFFSLIMLFLLPKAPFSSHLATSRYYQSFKTQLNSYFFFHLLPLLLQMISSYLNCQCTLSELLSWLTSLNDLSSWITDYSSCISSSAYRGHKMNTLATNISKIDNR